MDKFDPQKWPDIARLSEKLGASKKTLSHWKDRGKVPPSWQIRLVLAAPTLFTFADFRR